MQFYFAGSFAGNSSFKAVLAASPALFTAHYRIVVPAHNTPNKVSRELQQIWRGDYELLHISAVVSNSLQPFFLFAVLNASPRTSRYFRDEFEFIFSILHNKAFNAVRVAHWTGLRFATPSPLT